MVECLLVWILCFLSWIMHYIIQYLYYYISLIHYHDHSGPNDPRFFGGIGGPMGFPGGQPWVLFFFFDLFIIYFVLFMEELINWLLDFGTGVCHLVHGLIHLVHQMFLGSSRIGLLGTHVGHQVGPIQIWSTLGMIQISYKREWSWKGFIVFSWFINFNFFFCNVLVPFGIYVLCNEVEIPCLWIMQQNDSLFLFFTNLYAVMFQRIISFNQLPFLIYF